MRPHRCAVLAVFLFSLMVPVSAHAQARPTATQALRLSVFGGFSGADVDIAGNRLLGATLGADAGVRSFRGLEPSVELRGSYLSGGSSVDSQKSILVGARVGKRFGRIFPYGDILFGRGEFNYTHPGFPNPSLTLLYTYSASNVLSPGGGVELDATEHFALRLDGQYQRYAVPVTASGHAISVPLTAALVYRFNFNHRVHYDRKMP